MKRILAAIATLALMSGGANAADGTVNFTGLVTAVCAVTVGAPGILDVNANSTVLGSSVGGGSAGTATVLATGNIFSVTTIAPTAFLAAPAGGDDNVVFASTYSASGATTSAQKSGSVATPLNTGLTSVSVDLTATKSTGAFNAGAYAGVVTVRCE